MSAGSQIQMAPQSTVNSGQSVHNQDSNMSTGNFKLTFCKSESISHSIYNVGIIIFKLNKL